MKFLPLTKERWNDLETLFGKKGACGGCWCMWWRLKRKQFELQKGELNRKAFKKVVESGEVPGILAYIGKKPAGWCSFAPREKFILLENSKILKRVDDKPVWSIVCMFIDKNHREEGIASGIVEAAVKYAKKAGAGIVEAYPIEPKIGKIPDVFAYTGVPSIYKKSGFVEIARRSISRPIFRYFVV